MDSSNFRARRPVSPPPHEIPTHSPPAYSSHPFQDGLKEHWDADEWRAAASKGAPPHSKKQFPPDGLRLAGGEWKLLAVITLIAAGVRFFRLSKPNSVVYDGLHFFYLFALIILGQIRQSSL